MQHYFRGRSLYLLALWLECLGLCLVPWKVQAATYPPDVKWYQYPSEHFVIVYPQGLEEIARQVGPIAEEAYQRTSLLMNHEVKGTIFIVVKDNSDLSNGSATLIPQRGITVFISPPVNGEHLFDTRRKDYVKVLIQHELAHIAHLDTRRGVFRFIGAVFGRIFSPNQFLPPNLTEGVAVYSETKFEGGRGQGTLYDMVLRTDVIENRRRSIDETLVFTRQWPGGSIPYLYGYAFLDYLADTYGEETLAALSHATARRPIPFLLKGAFKRVYGKTPKQLWKDWQNKLASTYRAQTERLLAGGETQGETLFASKGTLHNVLVSPDGQTVYFFWEGEDNFPALVSFDLKRRQIKTLVKGIVPGKFALSPDGQRLFYSKVEPYKNFSFFGDLYCFDLSKKEEKRLTWGQRTGNVAIDPRGQSLLYTRQDKGMSWVERLDLQTNSVQTFPPLGEVTAWHEPLFLRDGSQGVVLGQNRMGEDSLYLLNLSDGSWKRIGVNANWMTGLSFDAVSGSLYFTTDIEGVPNIYAYDLATRRQTQMTSVYSGAFYSAVSGDILYYVQYTSKGYDLKRTLLKNSFRAVAIKKELPSDTGLRSRLSSGAPTKRYSPISQFFSPYAIVPEYSTDESGAQVGFIVAGGDILEHHDYELHARYSFEARRPSYEINYRYDRWYPTFSLSAFDVANLSSGIFLDASGNLTDFWERSRGGVLDVSVPIWLRSRGSLVLQAGYAFRNQTSLIAGALTPRPFSGNLSQLSSGIRFQFLEGARYAIAPAPGLIVAFNADHDDKKIGGDITRTRWVGEIHGYLPSFLKRQVLYLSGRGGFSSGDTLSQGDFKLGGDTNLSILHPEDEFFPIRGYPARSLIGRRFFLGQAEYRLPLIFVERGLSVAPIFLDNVVLVGFYDAGSAWDPGETLPFRDSAGGELRFSLLLDYRFPLNFRVGVARGFRTTGLTSIYYGVGGTF